MSWVTPEQFASLLDAECSNREGPEGPTQPFHGAPRKLTQDELLKPGENGMLALWRAGWTLKEIGLRYELTPERVRQIILRGVRRWEHHHGLEWHRMRVNGLWDLKRPIIAESESGPCQRCPWFRDCVCGSAPSRQSGKKP